MKPTELAQIRRGDVVWVKCEPSLGAEPTKTRTCVVISNDIANQFGQVIALIPTQRYTRERADRAYMVDLRSPRSTLKEERVANASMITSWDKARVRKIAGRVTPESLKRIEEAIRVHLDFE
jgi:mRNA interferase MazF